MHVIICALVRQPGTSVRLARVGEGAGSLTIYREQGQTGTAVIGSPRNPALPIRAGFPGRLRSGKGVQARCPVFGEEFDSSLTWFDPVKPNLTWFDLI